MPFLLNGIRSFFSAHIRAHLLKKLMFAAGFGLVLVCVFAIGSRVQAKTSAVRLEAPQSQDTAGGKAIFDEKCVGCHTIGGGKLVGPDLKGITQQRDPKWIKNFITDPAKMIASDADAQALLKEYNGIVMPTLGLTSDQVDQLVAFLSNPGTVPSSPAAAAPAGASNPETGKALFTGEKALAHGGPACMSCHNVSGTGALGGGGLGPDLTNVIQRYGEPGLSAALKTIPFPTMLGPFQNKPLTGEEQASLVAYFKYADQWNAPVKVTTPGAFSGEAVLIFVIGLTGAVLLFFVLFAIWTPLKKRVARHLPIRKV